MLNMICQSEFLRRDCPTQKARRPADFFCVSPWCDLEVTSVEVELASLVLNLNNKLLLGRSIDAPVGFGPKALDKKINEAAYFRWQKLAIWIHGKHAKLVSVPVR
jgi:hypothetical protein